MTAIQQVQALLFDVFGTVVDWRSSIVREVQELASAKGLDIDPAAFADAWRAGYAPAMHRVRTGELPWTRIDDLHRLILDQLLMDFDITNLTEAEIDHLNLVWHRLDPWPDSVEGLTRLKQKYVIATLSNGNVSLLVNMAKYGGLPWDCVLSAELARHYKPDPEAYRTSVDLLGLQPSQVMMVAAHNGDLKAAAAVGLRTAFVARPEEYGPNQKEDLEADTAVDFSALDFNDLATQLGA
ncbi:MAG: haloacid dehalogenase type II [Chloroflexota bacterium]